MARKRATVAPYPRKRERYLGQVLTPAGYWHTLSDSKDEATVRLLLEVSVPLLWPGSPVQIRIVDQEAALEGAPNV
jgi:hypothetical protein